MTNQYGNETIPTTRGADTTSLPVDSHGRVSKDDLRNFILNYIRTSSALNGKKPADGSTYKVDGSAESWAAFFVWLVGRESDYQVKNVGDVGLFDGNSNGLFQLSPNDAMNYHVRDTKFTLKELQDPVFNTTVAMKIAEHLVLQTNSIRSGIGRYWGPVKRGGHP